MNQTHDPTSHTQTTDPHQRSSLFQLNTRLSMYMYDICVLYGWDDIISL